MTAKKFHISDDGMARECKATTQSCEFGSDSEHYSTKEEAQTAYEKKMTNNNLKLFKGLSSKNNDVVKKQFVNELNNFHNDDEPLITDHIEKFIEENGENEWTPGGRYSNKFKIDDALARDVRKKTGVEKNVPVYIHTRTDFDGYSEYTQENEYSCEIECDGRFIEFTDQYGASSLDKIVDWLSNPDK